MKKLRFFIVFLLFQILCIELFIPSVISSVKPEPGRVIYNFHRASEFYTLGSGNYLPFGIFLLTILLAAIFLLWTFVHKLILLEICRVSSVIVTILQILHMKFTMDIVVDVLNNASNQYSETMSIPIFSNLLLTLSLFGLSLLFLAEVKQIREVKQ